MEVHSLLEMVVSRQRRDTGRVLPIGIDGKPMNRIKELREQRGWSLVETARRAETTDATISRLETGERQLTEKWLRVLAQVFGVHPAEILGGTIAVNLSTDVEPVSADDVTSALVAAGLQIYKVIGDSVSQLGIKVGDIIAVDARKEAISAIANSAVVLVRMVQKGQQPVLALRQYLVPGLLVTNRHGTNIATNLNAADMGITSTIVGVVIRQ